MASGILTTLLLFCAVLLVIEGGKIRHKEDSEENEDACQRYMDVAIVGAGPAGTYSAYRLREQNLRVEVFEYSNRVGGRLYTSRLPDAPDVPVELGGMRFIPQVHTRVMHLVQELGLTSRLFSLNYENTADSRFFLRGKSFLPQELAEGDIPYKLSAEEKANQGRIFRYYLEKLTGYNGTDVDEIMLLQLKVKDGRYLYAVPIDEALGMVATEEGRQFMLALDQFESDFASDTSLSFIENNIGPYSGDYPVVTVTEGMSAIPKGLLRAFLDASSRHQVTLNRKLLSIVRNDAVGYRLVFQKTQTQDGVTTLLDSFDVVCAKKIILALPRLALSQIEWNPLRDDRVNEAINAVRDVKVVKVFLTFPTRWWMDSSTYPARVTYSDLSFSQFYDWGRSNVTGHYIMLASYADETRAKLLASLNAKGNLASGSVGGPHRVTKGLVDSLLDDIAKAYGTDRRYIPEPISAMAQFWGSYPFGGGWVVWKAGYRYDDVISTVQRPSLTDQIFCVGADHSRGYHVGWSEGAYETVDRVMDMYFL
ncbi:L-amino-acid oxidase [Biomphalaria glabrata]|uniref:L-amino-acid oxidase-like n=1 Tax=Biomphalaria glabrata TaxID=6526 RepID=A0A9W3B6P6_BIOGL|nr:L-amino-acid oxidase-like [Biomphalaria glabrata]